MREQWPTPTCVEAWRDVPEAATTTGRGVVLIGHSQGTFVLREADPRGDRPEARPRGGGSCPRVLLGGNVTVKKGSDRGGDFKHVRACRRAGQIGCVIAFSTFNAPVPTNAHLRPHDRRRPALEVLCTNPAALGGGSAKLTPIYPSAPFAASLIGAAANLATQATCRSPKTAVGGASRAPTAATLLDRRAGRACSR